MSWITGLCIHGRPLREPCLQCGFTKQPAKDIAAMDTMAPKHDPLTCPVCMEPSPILEPRTSIFEGPE